MSGKKKAMPKLFDSDEQDLEALARQIAPPTPNLSTGAGYELQERQLVKQLLNGQVSPQMQRRLELFGIDTKNLENLLLDSEMKSPRTMGRAQALISKLTVLAKTSKGGTEFNGCKDHEHAARLTAVKVEAR